MNFNTRRRQLFHKLSQPVEGMVQRAGYRKPVPRQRSGGRRVSVGKLEGGRRTVPQQAEVTAGAEEDVEEKVEGDEDGQGGVQCSPGTGGLMQRRHIAWSFHLRSRRGRRRRVQATEPVQESPKVAPAGLGLWRRLRLFGVLLINADHCYRT